MRWTWAVTAAAGLAAFAGPARADDDVRAELEALKRQVREQERKIRELEGQTPTRDEVVAALDRYLADSPPSPVLVGGADGGKAGWPAGGAPFVQQGDNKINLRFRNQIRYSAFLYSDDAVGTLASPPNTISDDAPRDRSGFELERVYFGIDGTLFCPALTYNMTLNLDSDFGSGVEKEYVWLDWQYAGQHHVRAGIDKVAATYEEQNSTAKLAFVDRGLYCRGFALDSDTGIALWGYFGGCECPKRFRYRAMASTGEGPIPAAGSVFNTDAFDTYSDQLLYSASLEWNLTGEDWGYDEVDTRPCDKRCRLDASLGVWAYYENDDDVSEKSPGLALRSTGPLTRRSFGAWLRGQVSGFSWLVEAGMREVDYTAGSSAPTQTDWGLEATVHYRFPDSPWGIGARYSRIWLDDDYSSVPVGAGSVPIEDSITEFGFVVNYFVWDHANKITADVTWIQDNSAVSSSSAGYLVSPSKGVVVEDGVMLRLQWQVNF